MHDRTPQEDLLVVEALVEFSYRERDVRPERSARAWVLACELAAMHGLEIGDAISQRMELETLI
ncbi:hypothetical protein [Natronorubrum sp. DTA7]|uniref:hypothetical protein n=1 Tax=Natronorubrum sp. DTA7 TaxID=3447016 RepID=UPI003F842B5F